MWQSGEMRGEGVDGMIGDGGAVAVYPLQVNWLALLFFGRWVVRPLLWGWLVEDWVVLL
jgi:hypothetical protein